MKSFTTLSTLAAVAMAGIRTMAAPSTVAGVSELQLSEAPDLPDSECGIAVEFDLPKTSIAGQAIPGPPDFWCCDGYTDSYHGGVGKRLCCRVTEKCCHVVAPSIWMQPGALQSLKPVGSDVTNLMSTKNCGGSCQHCGYMPRINFAGYLSLKLNTC